MRKAERLFQIITLLRSRRSVITALQLAERLSVSERTIYRDIQALSLSGMPIESEAGVGYRLRPNFTVPPLMFNETELAALLMGVRMVQGWSSEGMSNAAESALNKIHAVLPEQLHQAYVQQPEWLIVPNLTSNKSVQYNDEIALAIKEKLKCDLVYTREDQQQSQRFIRPLGVIYWGKTWTLVAWCEKRLDYRLFRLDRIDNLVVTQLYFQDAEQCNLQHYLSLFKEC